MSTTKTRYKISPLIKARGKKLLNHHTGLQPREKSELAGESLLRRTAKGIKVIAETEQTEVVSFGDEGRRKTQLTVFAATRERK